MFVRFTDRGIYSIQFAELGKGKKKSASKKRGGEKSASETTIRRGWREKEGKIGKKREKEGKRGKLRETEGKKNREKREAVGKRGIYNRFQWFISQYNDFSRQKCSSFKVKGKVVITNLVVGGGSRLHFLS